MLCENCGRRDATTHVKRVQNGASAELHLCYDCAKVLGFSDAFGSMGFNIREIFTSLFGDSSPSLPEREERCENCGSSFNDIIRTGYVGCSECYRTFYDKLLPSVQHIHGKAVHNGKKPENIPEKRRELTKEEKIQRLQAEMDEKVKNQQFEEAVLLRDKIKALKEEQ